LVPILTFPSPITPQSSLLFFSCCQVLGQGPVSPRHTQNFLFYLFLWPRYSFRFFSVFLLRHPASSIKVLNYFPPPSGESLSVPSSFWHCLDSSLMRNAVFRSLGFFPFAPQRYLFPRPRLLCPVWRIFTAGSLPVGAGQAFFTRLTLSIPCI